MSAKKPTAIESGVPEQNTGSPPVPDERTGATFFFLWLFTVAVYARPEDIFPVAGRLHLTFVFGLCAGVTYLIALLSGRARLLWGRELRLVLLLTVWFVAGIPFSFWKTGSLQVFLGVWLKTLCIFFLLTQTMVSLAHIRKLVWAIVLSELTVTLFSVLAPSRVIWVGGRMLGVNQGILGWNFLGIAEAVTVPYIAVMFMDQRYRFKKITLIAAFMAMTWMLVQTASRGGLLNVVFSIAITLLLVLRGRPYSRVLGIGVAVVMIIVVAAAPDVFWQRLQTVWERSSRSTDQVAASAEESGEDRWAILSRSIQYTLERPVFGLGVGNFEVASGARVRGPDAWKGTHNTFTQLSSEAGIPALLLFTGLLVTVLRTLRKISKESANNAKAAELNLMTNATLASLWAFIFGAFFAHLAYEYYFYYLLAIAVGLHHVAQALATAPTQVHSSLGRSHLSFAQSAP